jgi:hypothetical protein
MTHHTPHLPPHLEGQSSWLSKATSARILGHPLVWSGMTGLFILTGYLWLQYYARPLSDQLGQLHSDSELVGAKTGDTWNPDIYRQTETMEKMPITRQADSLRAEKYRELIELENQIRPLLIQAREFMESETYTGNDENNAWENYQQILDIEPGHSLAQSGQAQILGSLQSNAEYATDEYEYEEAELWLGQLDSIEPNAPFQAEIRQRIADQISEDLAMAEARLRQAERDQLMENALQDAQDALRVTPPKLRAAYDLYLRALELDETSQAGLKGLRAIRQERVRYAEQAISDKNYAEARAQITRLQQIDAETTVIEKLESTLSDAQAAPTIAPPAPTTPEASQTSGETSGQTIGQAAPAAPPTSDKPRAKIEPISATAIPASRAPEPQAIAPQGIETVEIETGSKTLKPQTAAASANSKSRQLTKGLNAYYSGDYNTAFAMLHPLAEANSPRAQFRLGVMYYQGRTVVKNEDLARQWIARALPAVLRAAQKGQAWAQADLGTAYELGIGVKKDMRRAASLYQKAAKQGYAAAQTNLGVLYGTGEGINYDRKAAIYWLKKAAAQGDKIAQDNLIILNAR